MSKLVVVARVLLGMIFVVFGFNYFVPLMPGLDLAPRAKEFFQALVNSGYLFPVEKVVEIVGGVMILTGRLLPLGLTLLAPLVVNITLFHLFLDPKDLHLAALVLVPELFLAWRYRDAFQGVLAPRISAAQW